jgi:DMSO/TMAO reductase YedYZ molybdopterin-dependent catalytic subunit
MVERRLPPGQRALDGAPPRFGLERFVKRTVAVPPNWRLRIDGEVEAPLELALDEIVGEARVERTLDLHCVTTWTAPDLVWSGRAFQDFWEHVVVARARPRRGVAHVHAVSLDGFEAALPLDELLQPDVLLADRLHGLPLTLDHGAPLRLVIPQLYGYKNAKHLTRLSLRFEPATISVSRFLAHPRARVDLEERSGVGAQRLWRFLYHRLVGSFLRRARAYRIPEPPPPERPAGD